MFRLVGSTERMWNLVAGENTEEMCRSSGDMVPEENALDTLDSRSEKREADGDGMDKKRIAECNEEESAELSSTPTEAWRFVKINIPKEIGASLIENVPANATVARLMRLAQDWGRWRSMVAHINQDTAHR